MTLIARKWMHWLTAFALVFGSFAPAISQAQSLAHTGQGFAMEVCAPSGEKFNQRINIELPQQHELSPECAYCVAQVIFAIGINLALQFAKPASNTATPSAQYHLPKPYFSWLRLPSRAPPLVS